MANAIILLASDTPILDAAVQSQQDHANTTIYRYFRSHDQWQQHQGGNNWMNLQAAPQYTGGNDTVSFSGHGNNQVLGEEDPTPDDVTAAQAAAILMDMGFQGTTVIVSACGTHALLQTFGSTLSQNFKQLYMAQNNNNWPLAYLAPPKGVWAPHAALPQGSDPLTTYHQSYVCYSW